MGMLRRRGRPRKTGPAEDHETKRTRDLRIPNTTPDEVMRALVAGGAKPRPETKPQ